MLVWRNKDMSYSLRWLCMRQNLMCMVYALEDLGIILIVTSGDVDNSRISQRGSQAMAVRLARASSVISRHPCLVHWCLAGWPHPTRPRSPGGRPPSQTTSFLSEILLRIVSPADLARPSSPPQPASSAMLEEGRWRTSSSCFSNA